MIKIKYNRPSEDFKEINFGDKRLDKRIQKSVELMSQNCEKSVLGSCGSTYDAKAFYALLSNKKFSFEKVSQASHIATLERIKNSEITEVLLPQDTTDINLNGHKKTKGLGYSSNRTKGIQVHSCLALTPDGTILGLVSQQYETRPTAKSELPTEEKKKRPIEEKESYRWLETVRKSLSVIPEGVTPVILCDREGDFYELYAGMLSLNTSFIVRIGQDRTTTDGVRSIQQVRRTIACNEFELSIPRDTHKNISARTAKMEVAYCSVAVSKPKRISADVPKQLALNLIRITEIGETSEPIEWLLATNMSVENAKDTMKIVEYYTHRWKIERFHYILKSGCQVEKLQQRTYERILPVLFIFSVIASFILAMTYFARNMPDTPCSLFFEEHEWKILYRLITRESKPPNKPYSIKIAVAFLGELGGFKHKPSDGEYGVKAVWRGLIKLFDALDVAQRLMGQV